MEENITITKKRYEELLESERELGYLESYGVDNWEGYEDAMEAMKNDSE